ncbi:MAG: SIR2 family protein, partial [Alphaproteobacteria bacterium]|nr:SIR2 family protein [Alphaproteobacteria bacterium]
MPIPLEALARALAPPKTSLLIGAGACVPSGAPTGQQLATLLWQQIANVEPQSPDLRETATILERKYSRKAVVDVVVKSLSGLRPTGGLLGLPALGWDKLFTTNFDRLLEHAYAQQGLQAVAIRSNYDFSSRETSQGTRIFKIHGCITQDEALGDRASMTLTDHDYEVHRQYRQLLFSQLSSSLLGGDVLIIGQSLKDPHLSDTIREVLKAKGQGAPGQVYALIYESDEYRAPLLEDIGLKIAFGGIDTLVHALVNSEADRAQLRAEAPITTLPIDLVSTALDVAIEVTKSPNVLRMFNGGPATYADISFDATFERSQQIEVVEALVSSLQSVTILGAAGVGKTTFARQIAVQLSKIGHLVWEHKTDFPFQASAWKKMEANLRNDGKVGFLLIDECTHTLRQTNALIDYLSDIDYPALKLVMTANAANWAARMKSPHFFSKGRIVDISRLELAEINSLITLLERKPEIAQLVHSSFRMLTRLEKIQNLRQKCKADMFVCLKNIFANESLDIILLQEYDQLDPGVQDLYRYVAALEAVGARVHRQLMIRMLQIASDKVALALERLSGIVDEYDITPKDGVYGWRTRHLVIARKITDYKFSGLEELTTLFQTIIDNI